MGRIVFLAALGIAFGSVARSERRVVLLSFIFGLFYGGVELLVNAMAVGWPSPRRALLLLGVGLVLALPVYAIAEIWRRAHTRARAWLRRLLRR
jgi:hypothetical protein